METPFNKPQPQQPAPRPSAQAQNTGDTVPAMLKPGEGVLTDKAIRWHGLKELTRLEEEAEKGIAEMGQKGRIGGKPMGPPQGQGQKPHSKPGQNGQTKFRGNNPQPKPTQPPQARKASQGMPKPMPQQQQAPNSMQMKAPIAQQASPMQKQMPVPPQVRGFSNGGLVTQPYSPGSYQFDGSNFQSGLPYLPPSASQKVATEQQTGQASSAGQQTTGTGTSGSTTVGAGTQSSGTKGTGTFDPKKSESQQDYNEMKNGTNRGSPQGAGQAGGVTDDSTGTVEGGDFGRSVGEMIDNGNIQGLIDTATAPDAMVAAMDMLSNRALNPAPFPVSSVVNMFDVKGQLTDNATKDRQRARDFLASMPDKESIAAAKASAAEKSFQALSETSQAHGGAPPGSVGNVIGGYNTVNPMTGAIESYSATGSFQIDGPVPSLGTKAATDYFSNMTEQEVDKAISTVAGFEKDFMDKERENIGSKTKKGTEISYSAFGDKATTNSVSDQSAASGDFGAYGGQEAEAGATSGQTADNSGSVGAENETPD